MHIGSAVRGVLLGVVWPVFELAGGAVPSRAPGKCGGSTQGPGLWSWGGAGNSVWPVIGLAVGAIPSRAPGKCGGGSTQGPSLWSWGGAGNSVWSHGGWTRSSPNSNLPCNIAIRQNKWRSRSFVVPSWVPFKLSLLPVFPFLVVSCRLALRMSSGLECGRIANGRSSCASHRS